MSIKDATSSKTLQAKRKPPAPQGQSWLSAFFEYMRKPLPFLERIQQNDAPLVDTSLPGYKLYYVSDPEAIERIFVHNRKNYVKDVFLQRARSLFGNGLLVSEGEFWKRQRKLMAPSFAHRYIPHYAQQMVQASEAHLSTWRDGQQVDINDDMMGLTLEIALQSLFGTHAGDDTKIVGEAFTEISEYMAKPSAYLLPIPMWLPLPSILRFKRAKKALDGVVYRVIRERRALGGDVEHKDLLATLLAAQDEEGRGMTEEQLRDEVLILLLAGHETTAAALTFTWYLLAQHPEIEAKLHKELAEVLGDRPPSVDDLDKLVYTKQVFLEAMRLYPPAPVLGRAAVEDDELMGYHIPKGSMLTLSPWGMHRDPRFYEDPEQFRPERWTPTFQKQLPRFAYFPFGGGHRVCIGEAFAMMEGRLLIASLAQRYKLSLVDPAQPIDLLMSLTIRPKQPIRMALHAR